MQATQAVILILCLGCWTLIITSIWPTVRSFSCFRISWSHSRLFISLSCRTRRTCSRKIPSSQSLNSCSKITMSTVIQWARTILCSKLQRMNLGKMNRSDLVKWQMEQIPALKTSILSILLRQITLNWFQYLRNSSTIRAHRTSIRTNLKGSPRQIRTTVNYNNNLNLNLNLWRMVRTIKHCSLDLRTNSTTRKRTTETTCINRLWLTRTTRAWTKW